MISDSPGTNPRPQLNFVLCLTVTILESRIGLVAYGVVYGAMLGWLLGHSLLLLTYFGLVGGAIAVGGIAIRFGIESRGWPTTTGQRVTGGVVGLIGLPLLGAIAGVAGALAGAALGLIVGAIIWPGKVQACLRRGRES